MSAMIVRSVLIVLLLTCGLSLVLTIGIVAQSPDHSANGTNKVIIVLQPAQSAAAPGVSVLDQLGALGLYGLEPLGMEGSVSGTATYLGKVAPGVDVTGLIRDLERSPFVLRAELDVPRHFFAIDPDTGPLD